MDNKWIIIRLDKSIENILNSITSNQIFIILTILIISARTALCSKLIELGWFFPQQHV